MTSHTGLRWLQARRAARAATLAAVAIAALPTPQVSAATSNARSTGVVVLERAGAGAAPERAVRLLGGRVERRLDLVRGFTARLPRPAVARLRVSAGVRSVTLDRRFEPHADDQTAASDPAASLTIARDVMGAAAAPAGGAGVDVAVVDSGVAPVPGLDQPGRVINGADVSADAGEPGKAFVDAFGHGTHMAGIVSAIAPSARVVNVKVADHTGETTLGQILAGLDWVVKHRDRGGLNIRVVNLAFGAEVDGDHRSDPMAFAVECAWQRGIAVVAAAGNGGPDSTSLDSPAYDPYVIAAGASDTSGTPDRADDGVAEFSSRGSATRPPDVIAPGVGIVSARVPGGVLDSLFPHARIGEHGFRGSGTSQAAAMVSGASALVLGERPQLGPDAVKSLLRTAARPVAGAGVEHQGQGVVDVAGALAAPEPGREAVQRHLPAHGNGPWRGALVGVQMAVEDTANRWTANRWTANRWTANRWTANRWTANRWTSEGWDASAG